LPGKGGDVRPLIIRSNVGGRHPQKRTEQRLIRKKKDPPSWAPPPHERGPGLPSWVKAMALTNPDFNDRMEKSSTKKKKGGKRKDRGKRDPVIPVTGGRPRSPPSIRKNEYFPEKKCPGGGPLSSCSRLTRGGPSWSKKKAHTIDSRRKKGHTRQLLRILQTRCHHGGAPEKTDIQRMKGGPCEGPYPQSAKKCFGTVEKPPKPKKERHSPSLSHRRKRITRIAPSPMAKNPGEEGEGYCSRKRPGKKKKGGLFAVSPVTCHGGRKGGVLAFHTTKKKRGARKKGSSPGENSEKREALYRLPQTPERKKQGRVSFRSRRQEKKRPSKGKEKTPSHWGKGEKVVPQCLRRRKEKLPQRKTKGPER